MDAFLIVLWISVFVLLISAMIYYSVMNKKKQQKADLNKLPQAFSDMAFALKEVRHSKDNIEYCPKCGSHDIKVYREGYDYNKGFWLRLFDVKGGGYVAGMNSNRARCRCMNCGNDWETGYDYRLIK